MSPLTLKLIQVGFLVLLWLMVLSVAAVMRGDLFARRRTKPAKAPKANRQRKIARAAPAASGAAAAVGSGAGASAARQSVGTEARAVGKPPKPKRGAPRTLQITAGAMAGTTVELGASPITIGRLPENTVVLDDDYVSGRHARLYPHEGAWVVEDLGSTNGTYLDRARLTAAMVLPVGTPVRIGKTVLELRK